MSKITSELVTISIDFLLNQKKIKELNKVLFDYWKIKKQKDNEIKEYLDFCKEDFLSINYKIKPHILLFFYLVCFILVGSIQKIEDEPDFAFKMIGIVIFLFIIIYGLKKRDENKFIKKEILKFITKKKITDTIIFELKNNDKISFTNLLEFIYKPKMNSEIFDFLKKYFDQYMYNF